MLYQGPYAYHWRFVCVQHDEDDITSGPMAYQLKHRDLFYPLERQECPPFIKESGDAELCSMSFPALFDCSSTEKSFPPDGKFQHLDCMAASLASSWRSRACTPESTPRANLRALPRLLLPSTCPFSMGYEFKLVASTCKASLFNLAPLVHLSCKFENAVSHSMLSCIINASFIPVFSFCIL